MLTPEFFRAKFQLALPYAAYVATGSPDQRSNWSAFHARVQITGPQRELFGGFVRAMPVLVISGTWCGDCVQQCPMFDHIARAKPGLIDVRFLDRDRHKDLAEQVMICGGLRVPTVLFLNEDFEFVSLLGDRTISRYRTKAAHELGPACALPGAVVPGQEIARCLEDWMAEFERVQLLLRLSAKLSQRHGD